MIDARAYLLDVTDRRPNAALMQELVDILARYSYNEFFLYDAKGRDAPARLAAYCEMQGLSFVSLDAPALTRLRTDPATAWVETYAARSLCGRMEEMRRAMEQVARASRTVSRFLVADLSDGYAWHPVCVSLPAIILGGSLMSVGPSAATMDLEKELVSVMNLPVAGLLQKLGTLYLCGGARRENASEFFNILAGDVGYSRHPGLTQSVLDEVSAICRGVRLTLERWTDRNDWAKEIAFAANLLDCACHRRNETMLRALRDEHGRLWRLRSEPEGRVESLSKLPRF